MPPEEELIIRGKKKVNGEWVDVDATPEDTLQKDKSAPLATPPPKVTKEGVTNAVKVQRYIRDKVVPIVNPGMAPLVLVNAISKLVTGKDENIVPDFTTYLGTGEARNTLTNFGARGGAAAGGALTKSPGGASAGYGIGGTTGSLAGQGLEYLLPNLFKSGYEGGEVPAPNIPDAVKDVAVSGAFDLAASGASKVKDLVTNKKLRSDLVKWWITKQYDPANPKSMKSPIGAEDIAAINDNPNVPMTVGQVIGDDSRLGRIQAWLSGDRLKPIYDEQRTALGENLIDYEKQLGVPQAFGTQSQARQVGRAGVMQAQALKEGISDVEGKAFNEIPKFASTMKFKTGSGPDVNSDVNKFRALHGLPPIGGSQVIEEVLGPIKLTGLQTMAAVEVPLLDKMINKITDPALSAQLRIVRDRLAVGEGDRILPWETVRNMEQELGALVSNKNLPDALRQKLGGLYKQFGVDVEKNLSQGVKETAKYWKTGAKEQYLKAKGLTVREHDVFSDPVTGAMEKAAGDIPTNPGIRGGTAQTMYDDILKSPDDAERLAKSGGFSNARSAFLSKFRAKFVNPETKQIDADGALADLASDNTKAISNLLLSKNDRQKLRQFLLVSKRVTPSSAKLGQHAIEQTENGMVLNVPGDAARALFAGQPASLTKSIVKFATIHLGGDAFARNFLLNDKFARDITNSLGKAATRPGMGQELKTIINNIQGAKVLIEAGGKKFIYDTDTKKVEEQK